MSGIICFPLEFLVFMLTENVVTNTLKIYIFSLEILKPTLKFFYQNRNQGCIFFHFSQDTCLANVSEYMKLFTITAHTINESSFRNSLGSKHCTGKLIFTLKLHV